jgi:transposase-like protein
MKSSVGEFELKVPRDRNGTFEPKIVKKYLTHMSEAIEEKILSLYALGNRVIPPFSITPKSRIRPQGPPFA